MQGAFVSEMFALPVTVLVKNASNVPQAGVTVSSTVPGSGASCTTAASAVTNGSGIASFSLTANATAGQYTVSFGSSGAVSVGALFRNSTLVTTSQTKTPTLCTQEVVPGISGSLVWSNPGFIIATGTSNYAQLVSGATADSMQLLKGSVFGFSIPTGATYRGAEFFLYGWRSSGSNIITPTAVMYKGAFDLSGSRIFSATTAWRAAITVGSSTDNWGSVFAAADFNDSTFAVGVYGSNGVNVTVRSNEWSLKIYYSTAAALPVLDTAAPLVFCAN